MYRGPFVYRKGSGSSSLTLESAAFGGGRLTPDGALLYMTDYLGSVRAVVDGTTGQIYKAVDYSAYGAESDVMVPQQGSTPEHALAAAALPSGMTLRDSFTGQEDQTPDFGTSYTDFGARQYSPALRRWMTPDPMSEKYYGTSPYAFCNNNPVNFVDPDGEAWETAWDILNVIYDAGAAVYNHVKKDHDRAREHWKNAAYDGLAAVVPGLPAGFSKLRHVDEAADAIGALAKAANTTDNAADAAKAAERSVSNISIETTLDVLPDNQISRELLDKPNKRGNAFVFKKDGTAVEIHHVGQNADGPYIEMHRSEHRGKGNYKVNHPNVDARTQIDREEFNKQRRHYWQKEYDKYYK